MKKPPQVTEIKVESKSAFAARVGLSAPRISQLIKRGLPVLDTGKVPVQEALKWMREFVKPQGGRPIGSFGGGTGEDDADLEAAKIRLTLAQAERAELELALRRGELCQADAARSAVRTFAGVQKQTWLNAAPRYGADLAAEIGADPRVVIPAFEKILRMVMHAIADTPFPKIGNEPGGQTDAEAGA